MQKNNEIVIFETEDNQVKLPVNVKDETVWLNRNQMSELFDRDVKTIGKHINNALREELADQVVVAKFAPTTQSVILNDNNLMMKFNMTCYKNKIISYYLHLKCGMIYIV